MASDTRQTTLPKLFNNESFTVYCQSPANAINTTNTVSTTKRYLSIKKTTQQPFGNRNILVDTYNKADLY